MWFTKRKGNLGFLFVVDVPVSLELGLYGLRIIDAATADSFPFAGTRHRESSIYQLDFVPFEAGSEP